MHSKYRLTVIQLPRIFIILVVYSDRMKYTVAGQHVAKHQTDHSQRGFVSEGCSQILPRHKFCYAAAEESKTFKLC